MDKLKAEYDKLQIIYGDKNLHSIYGCGCEKMPNVALVFMNPTKKNIASNMSWSGLRAQWLGTKQIWGFLTKCGLFDGAIYEQIKSMTPSDWTPEFCDKVYENVDKHGVWITNLAKCTQLDARALSDNVFKAYRELLMCELDMVKPKVILLFGNQVSSVVLGEKISVSSVRCKRYNLMINKESYPTYAVYYPVGNGRFNQDKAVEDVCKILKHNKSIGENR